MNIEESLKGTNSWHWLSAAVVISAVASVFLPAWGWNAVVDYKRGKLDPQEKRDAERLSMLRGLSEDDAEAPAAQAKRLRDRAASERARFTSFGFEELPSGEEAVFAAQRRINEALARHRISIVSSDAKIAVPSRGASAAPAPKPQPEKKPATAAEFRRDIEAAAAGMKDRALREVFLADARRKLAAMEEAERHAAASPSAAVQRPSPAGAGARANQAPFKSSLLAYSATGDFRDMFMFLVEETHKRPNYALSDISVAKTEGGAMSIDFTLEVHRR